MGAKQSAIANSNDDNRSFEDDDQACQCNFLGLGKKLKSLSSDPMGTPLPNTPQHLRRKREEIVRQAKKKPVVMMSMYSGLEKETEAYYDPAALLLTPPNGNGSSNGNGSKTVVHEGKDADKALHAKYELLEVLGVGSTCTVHRCMHRTTMQMFACKIIDQRNLAAQHASMMDQFRTEIQALTELSHPNIIKLYDVYILTDEKIFIVMELMEGGELFDYVVQKGTLTEKEASVIVRKVTSAIVYMHSKNIIHRDLKPENLLLQRQVKNPMEIQVKIIDFGLSKCFQGHASGNDFTTGTFLGTRGYLAPEMLQRLEYNKAVDTWALGVIVFVLLCGCLPFDDDSQAVPTDDLVRARFVLRFPRWAKDLSPSAKDVLSNLLSVSATSRYTAEQALQHPWVQGDTAPQKSYLNSPGRIQPSPRQRKGGGRHKRTTSRDYNTVIQQGNSILMPPSAVPKRNMVRKTSI